MTTRIGDQRPRWSKTPPAGLPNAWAEVSVIAEQLGWVLDDWQRWWVTNCLTETPDGKWWAKEAVLITARQNGKNICLGLVELAGVLLFDEKLVVHSAHEVPTALNHYEFLVNALKNSPLASLVADTPHGKGYEAIVFTNGNKIRFRARGKNSGRGLTGDRIVFDEALHVYPQAMGALIPLLRARPNTQVVYASSAAKTGSVVLHSLISRGESTSSDRLFYANWGNPAGTPLTDEDGLAAANPTLGIRISMQTLKDEYQTFVSANNPELMAEYSREAMGISEPPPGDSNVLPVFEDGIWDKLKDIRSRVNGRSVVGVGVDQLAASSAIGVVGKREDGMWHYQIDQTSSGVDWLVPRLDKLLAEKRPRAVAVDVSGAVQAVLPAIAEVCKRHKVDLVELSNRSVAGACQAVELAVTSGSVRHLGQGPLDTAAVAARPRSYGKGLWVWASRPGMCTLEAVTVAHRAFEQLPPARSSYEDRGLEVA